MIYQQIFVRKEPTTDELSLKAGLYHQADVIAYSDRMCTKRLARWAWFQGSRPRARNETVMVAYSSDVDQSIQQRDQLVQSL